MNISAKNRRGSFIEGLGNSWLDRWLLGRRNCGQKTKSEETQRLQERRRAWAHATSYYQERLRNRLQFREARFGAVIPMPLLTKQTWDDAVQCVRRSRKIQPAAGALSERKESGLGDSRFVEVTCRRT